MTQRTVTANRLTDGIVVYLTQSGDWSDRLGDAYAVDSEEEQARLLQQAEDPQAALHVVGPYLIDVDAQGGTPNPLRKRERIRAEGPTVETETARAKESH